MEAGGKADEFESLEKVNAWEWIEELDELRLVMRENLAFYGFQEGTINFPPSFKFFAGRRVEDYSEAEDLRYGYQTTTEAGSGSSAGEARPPSW